MDGARRTRAPSGTEYACSLGAAAPDVLVPLAGLRRVGGVPIDEKLWMASRVRDGRVTWWRNFVSEGEALEAAGLRE
jgi:hypothetical protein